MEMLASISAETMYTLLNFSVLPFWLLLILVPLTKPTDTLVHSVLMPLVLGVTYAWFLATALWGPTPMPDGAGFGSLEALRKVFSMDTALIAGWAHYLVFDLFIGAWQARDAQRIGLNHFLLVPCLVVTLVVGPIGLLLYVMVRGLTGRGGWSLFEG